MKIAFLVGHPTQFEGPFYQQFEKLFPGTLEVIYFNTAQPGQATDAELGFGVNWGIDLTNGYSWQVLPQRARLSALKKILKEGNYDFVIVNGYNRKILIEALILCKLHKTPVALRLDTVLFQKEILVKRLYRYILINLCDSLFDHFLVTGIKCRQYLTDWKVALNKTSVLSYVVDNNYFVKNAVLSAEERTLLRSKFNVTDKSKIVLCISKLVPRESPWDVIKAMEKFSNRDIHLVIAGDGYERGEIEVYAKSIPGLKVTFLGHMPYVDLPKLYALADLFIHSVLDEPWGVSIQEAIACGLPVITSDRVGASYDLIKVGENGFIYPYGDYDLLSKQIETILYKLSLKEIKACNDAVLLKWNFNETAERLFKLANSYGA